jgi:hypothetical protein
MNQNLLFDHPQYRNQFFANLNEKIISKIHKEVKKQNSITGVWTDE